MASESEECEDYAYSSEEDEYPMEEDDVDEVVEKEEVDMEWSASRDNPNAAPMNYGE